MMVFLKAGHSCEESWLLRVDSQACTAVGLLVLFLCIYKLFPVKYVAFLPNPLGKWTHLISSLVPLTSGRQRGGQSTAPPVTACICLLSLAFILRAELRQPQQNIGRALTVMEDALPKCLFLADREGAKAYGCSCCLIDHP